MGLTAVAWALGSLLPATAHPGRLPHLFPRPPEKPPRSLRYLTQASPPPLRLAADSGRPDRTRLYLPPSATEVDASSKVSDADTSAAASPPITAMPVEPNVISEAGGGEMTSEETSPAKATSLDDFLILFKGNVDQGEVHVPFQLPGETSEPPPRQSRARYSVAP